MALNKNYFCLCTSSILSACLLPQLIPKWTRVNAFFPRDIFVQTRNFRRRHRLVTSGNLQISAPARTVSTDSIKQLAVVHGHLPPTPGVTSILRSSLVIFLKKCSLQEWKVERGFACSFCQWTWLRVNLFFSCNLSLNCLHLPKNFTH